MKSPITAAAAASMAAVLLLDPAFGTPVSGISNAAAPGRRAATATVIEKVDISLSKAVPHAISQAKEIGHIIEALGIATPVSLAAPSNPSSVEKFITATMAF